MGLQRVTSVLVVVGLVSLFHFCAFKMSRALIQFDKARAEKLVIAGEKLARD